MKQSWIMTNIPDMKEIKRTADELSLPLPVVKILFSRNIKNNESIKRFINPSLSDMYDPFLMKGMDKAVKRILKAIEIRENIMIFGDYDADGITSTAMLMRFLKECGSFPIYYIPNRVEDGYGLSVSGIDFAIKNNVNLIITVDCGITAFQEVVYAQSKDIDLVITDHHEVLDKLPSAAAIVNPNREEDTYPFKSLAGCGVAFKLIQALAKSLDYKGNIIDKYIDFVTLGTVADVVPLLDENRIISYYGLRHIAKSENPGIQKLIEVSQIDKKKITSFHIGFILAPRINAMGRMSDATNAVKLLITDDLNQAEEIANELNRKNKLRQEVDQEVFDEAVNIIEKDKLYLNRTIVLHKENWHEGVIGIVASRLVEKYHKPTIMISMTEGVGKGSGRSIPAFHLYDVLKSMDNLLVSFGGHRLAAGITIKKENIELFKNNFEEKAEKLLSEEFAGKTLEIDCEITLDEIDSELEENINLLSPFGYMNSKPVFLSKKLSIVGYPAMLKEKHLRVCFKENIRTFEAIWFNNGKEHLRDIAMQNKKFDVVYYISKNEYAGREVIQLQILDMRVSDE